MDGSAIEFVCVYGSNGRNRKTKIRNLLKMGVPMELAWQAGNSRRGHWFTTHTLAIGFQYSIDSL